MIVDETYQLQWTWSKQPGSVLSGAPHVHLITANVPRTRRTPKWELRINLLGNYNANYICQLCLTKLTFAILLISWQHSNWWGRNRFYHTEKSFAAAAARPLLGLNIQVTHELSWRSISSAFYSQVNRKENLPPYGSPRYWPEGKNQSMCVFLRRTIS